MPRCPKCKQSFRVLEDEDDGQHSCPRCGYDGYNCHCEGCGAGISETQAELSMQRAPGAFEVMCKDCITAELIDTQNEAEET